jgi:uncharacterized protein YbaP (TraB family)
MFSKRLLLSLLSALAFYLLPQASPAANKVFMWKITSGASTVYLVGSIHMVPKDFYPLPAEIEKAFDDSSTLVLEIDERKADPASLAKVGIYTDGDDIDNHLNADTKAEFDKYADTQDSMTRMTLHKMRPWCAANTIGILEVQKRGFDKDYGVDKHFLQEAEAKNKTVEELETIDSQIHAFSDFSDDLQDKLLKSSLVDMGHMDEDAKDMLGAWKTGDADLMDKVATRDEKENPDLQPVMEKLLYERNIGMAQKIEQYLKTGKKTFVVVGSAHVTGPRGLVALLGKTKKYKIEQVSADG